MSTFDDEEKESEIGSTASSSFSVPSARVKNVSCPLIVDKLDYHIISVNGVCWRSRCSMHLRENNFWIKHMAILLTFDFIKVSILLEYDFVKTTQIGCCVSNKLEIEERFWRKFIKANNTPGQYLCDYWWKLPLSTRHLLRFLKLWIDISLSFDLKTYF